MRKARSQGMVGTSGSGTEGFKGALAGSSFTYSIVKTKDLHSMQWPSFQSQSSEVPCACPQPQLALNFGFLVLSLLNDSTEVISPANTKILL